MHITKGWIVTKYAYIGYGIHMYVVYLLPVGNIMYSCIFSKEYFVQHLTSKKTGKQYLVAYEVY